jgi:predicted KAP-like P-loop ATPase
MGERPVGHWTDDPLTKDAEDQLDRLRIADRVAEVIGRASRSDNSSVFGLVGPWGDGKSTLINFVIRRLKPE